MGQCNGVSSTATLNSHSLKPCLLPTENGLPETKVDNTDMGDVILSPNDLMKLMNQHAGNLRILDVTAGGEDGYKSAHIRGAVYMDIFHEVEATDLLVRNIPTPDVFQAYVRSLGINADSDVVIYDKADAGGGYMSAGRAWFLFRYHGQDKVRILDGGLGMWKECKHETTSDIPAPQEGDFTAVVRKDLLKSFEEIVDNLDTKAYQVFDTRPPLSYQQGHIKGAKNLPFGGKIVDPGNKCLRTIAELKTVFADAEVDISKPLIGSCTGGMTSCAGLVAAAIMGNKDVPLYLGSWMEWSQRASENQIERS